MLGPSIPIPVLVRVKPGALDHLPRYLRRFSVDRVALYSSEGFIEPLAASVALDLEREGFTIVHRETVRDASWEHAQELFAAAAPQTQLVVGLGGGKALDVAKYVAFLGRKPYVAVPTSLSNDGFCSPQASLTVGGRRRSLPAALPAGVVVDTAHCAKAPSVLFQSGVGDLASKLTAVRDWKLAFHANGEAVNDLAALLSDSTVHQFLSHPRADEAGLQLLATALLLNGIAMEICGSSRPASGSEHLISHALDELSLVPALHGLQVGLATYLVAQLQGRGDDLVLRRLFEECGFFAEVERCPFERGLWHRAIDMAPTVKERFHTVLAEPGAMRRLHELVDGDAVVASCFRS